MRSSPLALRLARRDQPDLAVADVMMPRMDGFALLSAIRADHTLAATPVILVTARAGEETAIEGLLAGADDYVVKPFSARELMARAEAQLQLAGLRRRVAAADAYRLALTDALQALEDPTVIQQRAVEMLCQQLGVDNVHYAEVDTAGGVIHVRAEHSPGAPSFLGTYPLHQWGGELLERTLGQGRTIVVNDITTYDIDQTGRTSWRSVGARAAVEAPLICDGQWAGHLAVLQDRPRNWTPDDVALVEETAARTWAFVERARAERELRRFAALIEASDEIIGICDLQLVPLFGNAAGLRHSGLDSMRDPRVRTVLDFIVPEDRAAARELHARVLREGRGKAELRLRHFGTGETRRVIHSVVLLTETDGEPVGFATVTRDITERKHTGDSPA